VYSEKHKRNLKSFQVIAGLQERVYLGRPVIQELLDQLEPDLTNQLVGLDLILEVLDMSFLTNNKPVYYCTLCGDNFTDLNFPTHVVSPVHVFNFLREHLPGAWHRFSTLENTANWSPLDYQAYTSILRKVNDCCGMRKPIIVESRDRLEEAIDKLDPNLYTSKREDIEAFVKSLPVVDTTNISSKPLGLQRTRTIARIAVSLDDVALPPLGKDRVQCKITNVPHAQVVKDKFVLVSQSPKNSMCSVSQSFCKVLLVNQVPIIMVSIHNTRPDTGVNIPSGADLALVKWKK
jgi:hypothetical protein